MSLVQQVVALLLGEELYQKLKALGLNHITRVMEKQVMTRDQYEGPDRAGVLAQLETVFVPVTAKGLQGVLNKVGIQNVTTHF